MTDVQGEGQEVHIAPPGAPAVSLTQGRWELADLNLRPLPDVLITDPPYSSRTHEGFRSGSDGRDDRVRRYGLGQPGCQNRLAYEPLRAEEAEGLVVMAREMNVRWFVSFGDHTSFALWEQLLSAEGFLTFAPVIWAKRDAPPRMAGDGPQSSVEYLAVARPRRRVSHHGSRPGFYLVGTDKRPLAPDQRIVGMKRLQDVTDLVLDYTVPGDVVFDPYAGTAPIAEACLSTGRGYVGYECDPHTFTLAAQRLRSATLPIPGMAPNRWSRSEPADQLDLERD